MIAALLEAAGHPLGHGGHTTCPLHQGHNRQAFSYTDTAWYCWAGCGGGGEAALRERLGLTRDPTTYRPQHPVLGICLPLDELGPGMTPSRWLTEAVATRTEVREAWAARQHREAVQLDGLIRRIGLMGRFKNPELLEEAHPVMQAAYDRAHRAWGPWPWPCGCYQ